MLELRHKTQQVVQVGVFTENKVPCVGWPIDWFWSHLIKADRMAVDIKTRTWKDIPKCYGSYFLTLLESDVDVLGPLSIYFYGPTLDRPIFARCVVIRQNVFDSKYSDQLLEVSKPEAC